MDVLKDISVICLDTETTGLDFNNDDIVEFSAVVPLEDDVKTIDFYLPTDRPITESARRKNRFTKASLLKKSKGRTRKQTLRDIMNLMKASVNDTLFIAMNMPFDLTMIHNNLNRYIGKDDYEAFDTIADIMDNIKCFDVFVMDKILRPSTNGGNRRLETLADVYGTVTKPSHNSLDDAKCTLEIAIQQLQSLAESKTIDITDLDAVHEYMCERAVEQQESLNEFFKKVGHEPVDYIGFPYYETY